MYYLAFRETNILVNIVSIYKSAYALYCFDMVSTYCLKHSHTVA